MIVSSIATQRLATQKDVWKIETPCFESTEDFYTVNADHQLELINQYCAKCDWIKPCLTLALLQEELYGIWGGTTEKQRKALIKRYVSGADTVENIVQVHIATLSQKTVGKTTT